jgi:exonuclease VII small subunit
MNRKKILGIVLGGLLMMGENLYASSGPRSKARGKPRASADAIQAREEAIQALRNAIQQLDDAFREEERGVADAEQQRKDAKQQLDTAERQVKHLWLYRWRTIGDVNEYAKFLNKYGHEDPRINEEVIQNTLAILGFRFYGNQWNPPVDRNQLFQSLCVFTCASYSVANYVQFGNDDISSLVKIIIGNLPFDPLGDDSGIILESGNSLTPQNYTIRWAWLLFLSQIEDHAGAKLKDNYEVYPITMAKEFLGECKGAMKKIAEKMLERIDTAEKNVSSSADELSLSEGLGDA